VTYFKAVRIYSAIEVCIFTSLVVVAIGGLGDRTQLILGWTHGFGWIALCIAVAVGCRRGVFPWPLLAATVSPLGPVGSTIGLEYLARRRRAARRVA
jgi:hypothetical protein